jgi:hypothetical protein
LLTTGLSSLFVAPVESDLPSKASGKNSVLAPVHAGTRPARNRGARVVVWSDGGSGEPEPWSQHYAVSVHHRNLMRREHDRQARLTSRNSSTRAEPNVLVVPPPNLSGPPPVDDGPGPGLDHDIDIVDQAMDEFLSLDRPTRERFIGELNELLGDRWNHEGLRARLRIMSLRESQGLPRRRATESLGNWTAVPRPQARRARVVSF